MSTHALMRACASVIATSAILPASAETYDVVAVIRNAYEDNTAALSSSGTLRFHATDGVLARARASKKSRIC